MNVKRMILIICVIGLLIIAPVSAKEVTAKVDDKGLLFVYDHRGGIVGTLHTCYGEITVNEEDYNNIMVNDTIKYDTDMVDFFWTIHWDVEKVN